VRTVATEIPTPGVFLDAKDCALIDRALRLGLAELTARNGGTSGGVEQVAAVVLRAASAWRSVHERRPGEVGAQPRRSGEVPPAELTPSEAAAHLGVSESCVRRMAADGRLSARRTPTGRWAVDAISVAVFAQQRAAQWAA
jgi:excisionase family DNA binding protein